MLDFVPHSLFLRLRAREFARLDVKCRRLCAGDAQPGSNTAGLVPRNGLRRTLGWVDIRRHFASPKPTSGPDNLRIARNASFASKSAALHIQAVRGSDTPIPEPGVFYGALLVTEIYISKAIPLRIAIRTLEVINQAPGMIRAH